MSRPPLHALQGFVAAARSGNLSRTAESLHLTVSALSHQIRGLEERVGTPLFVRKARGVVLTPDGEQLFQHIAPHLAAIEDALRPYRARRDDVLTITLMPSFATSWLLPRLPQFVSAHPQIEINMQTGVGLVDFERDRTVDAGLRYGPGRWPGLNAVHLFDDWVTPVASPALVERLGRPTLKTLGDFPLLGAPGGRWSQWFEHFGGHAPRRYVATFDDSETLHRAAAEGLGIGLGRMSLLRPTIDAGRLLRLFDERLPAEFAHYLVHPSRSAGHAGLALFRDWVVDEAQRYVEAENAAIAPKPKPKAASRQKTSRRRG
ncbi:MAG TPA: LysR substrate-binding domain-containing protein [Xanthomonadaceae bacterium]|jgi:LysR family glycine cleavage system transcriptional activator